MQLKIAHPIPPSATLLSCLSLNPVIKDAQNITRHFNNSECVFFMRLNKVVMRLFECPVIGVIEDSQDLMRRKLCFLCKLGANLKAGGSLLRDM